MVLEAEATRAQVNRILQNKSLRLSEVQRRLLSYLADKSLAGEADELKEYTVGIDAFGKPPSYDPRQESVVRMHVGRLRQKLADYYRTEGIDDPIIIDLPKGNFKVTFEPRPAVETPAPPPPPVRRWGRRETAFAACLAFAISVGAYFSTRPVNAQRPNPENASWTSELQQLWTPILSSNTA